MRGRGEGERGEDCTCPWGLHAGGKGWAWQGKSPSSVQVRAGLTMGEPTF